MDKSELSIYIKQFIALLMVYIACLLPIIYSNPEYAEMNCDEAYHCNVKQTYHWNIQQTGSFYVSKDSKLRFYNNSYNNKSGYINIYDDGSINYDPFGTSNFYDYKDINQMNNDSARFDEYIKNPHKRFSINKRYNMRNFYLFGILATLFVLACSFTKRPIEPIMFIIRAIFFRSFRGF